MSSPFHIDGIFSEYSVNILYGVRESDPTVELDYEWLENQYDSSVGTYDIGVNDGLVRNPDGMHIPESGLDAGVLYGVDADMNTATGQLTVDAKEKEMVLDLYAKLCKYCENTGRKPPTIGYYTHIHIENYKIKDGNDDVSEMIDTKEYVKRTEYIPTE